MKIKEQLNNIGKFINDRFFSGDENELQEIKNRENIENFKKRKENKKRFKKILIIAGAVIGAIVFFLICFSVFFRVKNINVEGSKHYKAEDILASGVIQEGQSIFGINGDEFDAICENYPYLNKIEVERDYPSTVIIKLEDCKAEYYCEIYGEFFILSGDLKVLDRHFALDFEYDKMMKLYLPEVKRAVVGLKVIFAEDVSEKYVSAYLDALKKSKVGKRVREFDLRDRFGLQMICDSKFLVSVGDGVDISTKLATLDAVLKTEAFNGVSTAIVDVSDPSECSAIPDSGAKIEIVK